MANYAFRTETIGLAASPTSEIPLGAVIVGTSIAKGDASDSSTTTLTAPTFTLNVGFTFNVSNRFEGVLYLAIPSRIKRGSRVIAANLNLRINNSEWPSDTVPIDGTNYVEVWPIRRTLSSSLTGLTFQNYTTGSAWQEYGIKFGTGSDTDSTFLTTFTWSQANHDTVDGGSDVVKAIDLRSEFQRLLDFDEPLQLALRPRWVRVSGQNSRIAFTERSDVSSPHTYVTLNYKNPIEIYGSTGGSLNLLDLKDVASAGLQQHLYLGTPPRGSSGTLQKYWVRNEIDVAQPAIVLHAGTAHAGSTDNSGVVGSGRCRFVRVYDTTASNQSADATWKLTFTGSSSYNVSIKPDGSTSFVTTGITSPTGRSTGSNEVIVYNSLNALSLPSSAFTGTFASGDVVTVETRADRHSTTTPVSGLDDVYLAPHAVGDRTAALTTKKRAVRYSKTCQLYGDDISPIANSGGASGVIGNVSGDGSNDGTHVKVPDPSIFRVNDWATLATFDAADEPGSGTRVEHVQIKNVYPIGGGGSYEGQVGFYEVLGTLGDFTDTSILTSGVWIGTLNRPDQTFLSATASTSSPNISLSTALVGSTGQIVLVDLNGGTSETKTISSVSVDGLTVTLTAAPSYAYPAGTLVYRATETDTNCPFFAYADPPGTATRGRKQGYVSVMAYSVT